MSGSVETDFRLEGSVPEGHMEAAAFWGVSRKTLQRWKAAGKEKGDPCPWREPGKMVEWYQRIFEKAVPEAIFKTLERLGKTEPPEPEPVEEKVVLGGDLVEESSRISRLRAHELALYERYRKALELPDMKESQLARYREEWQEAAAEVSKHEQRAKRTGELMDPAEFDHGFRRFLAKLPQAIMQALPPALSVEQRRQMARETCQRLPDSLEQLLAS